VPAAPNVGLKVSRPLPLSSATLSPVAPADSDPIMSRSLPSAWGAATEELAVVPSGNGAMTVCGVVKVSMDSTVIPWAWVLSIATSGLTCRVRFTPPGLCTGCSTK
jgi:hypothetical protein